MVIPCYQCIIYIVVNSKPILVLVYVQHLIEWQTVHCSPICFPRSLTGCCIVEGLEHFIYFLACSDKFIQYLFTPLWQVIVGIGNMCDSRYSIPEPAYNLDYIRVWVKHGLVCKEHICNQYDIRFEVQFDVHRIKEATCEEVILSHVVYFPILITSCKLVLF